MIEIIPADKHYHKENEWLSTYWHFSFDQYYDPANMNFGPLRVFNDDTIQPAKGFGFHPHRDMEIVTYVVEGELEHRDNQGNKGLIHPGEVQVMSAGSGIVHSEYNHSKDSQLKLLQIWLYADQRGLAPSWSQHKFSRELRLNKLLPVVIPHGYKSNGALPIHQDAKIYISSLKNGKTVDHTLGEGRKAYVFVIDGQVRAGDRILNKRDAARIKDEEKIVIKAEEDTEIILLDLPQKFLANGSMAE